MQLKHLDPSNKNNPKKSFAHNSMLPGLIFPYHPINESFMIIFVKLNTTHKQITIFADDRICVYMKN